MTPNDLEVLIHFYVSPHHHPRRDAPAVKDAIAKWGRLGMIKGTKYEDVYQLTKTGEMLLSKILSVDINQAIAVASTMAIVENAADKLVGTDLGDWLIEGLPVIKRSLLIGKKLNPITGA